MKRDWNIIRSVLLAREGTGKYEHDKDWHFDDKMPRDIHVAHLDLMQEGGFLTNAANVWQSDLAMLGHEFLAFYRDDALWKQTMDLFDKLHVGKSWFLLREYAHKLIREGVLDASTDILFLAADAEPEPEK